ncbi:N-acetyltransferase [Ancylomarina euxinus]|uniref:N-acetyltransferase n=1 Tax=Ancylomarina euxinus TaxID=2283627 RepID=A0A425Y8J9_9BACT|nr:GNAT family protein [Ancylomarina euxinus]MCZ4693317.1 GNAT family protein [Ancylomarina euxinus]MUP13545.1 GNAT family N-acetyltransferase [Ancylomarina euxinus]RRG24806.1 N-acetyltransferase [Ancylomarina euxinus]
MIELKALNKLHISSFYKWLNDSESIRYSLSAFQKTNSPDEVDVWFQSVLEDTKGLNLGIFLRDSEQLIGFTGICKISRLNKSGEYFIFIGDKSQWNKGIGCEVTRLVLKIAFCEKGLNRLMLTVSEPNIGGLKAYQKAGFTPEGKLRQACFRDGAYHDKIIMSILKNEYLKSVKA